MNIGLTGGIACGKTTVSTMLVELGAVLIDADQIAREVVLPGSPVLIRVVERFGSVVLLEDGSLNRKKLGQMVFNNPQALKALEAILHPPIRAIIKERMDAFQTAHPASLVVVDVPLLFESGQQSMYSEIMVVYVPPEIQLKRLMDRDKLSAEEGIRRINTQMPIEEKKRLADIVIDNSGTLQETRNQVLEFWRRKGTG
jgi:dephospho-CoA kinase